MFFFRQSAPAGMSAADAVAKASTGDITLIDVREHAEVAASGLARGALHMPLSRLRDMADRRHPDYNAAFSADKPIALYCASGGRSANAAMLLEQLGFGDVHNIGGLGHWVQAGGAVDRA